MPCAESSDTNLPSRAALRNLHLEVERAIEIRVLKGTCVAAIRNGSLRCDLLKVLRTTHLLPGEFFLAHIQVALGVGEGGCTSPR